MSAFPFLWDIDQIVDLVDLDPPFAEVSEGAETAAVEGGGAKTTALDAKSGGGSGSLESEVHVVCTAAVAALLLRLSHVVCTVPHKHARVQ